MVCLRCWPWLSHPGITLIIVCIYLIHLDIGLTDLCLRLAMRSATGQSEVGVHRLLRFLTLSPDCHSSSAHAQDVLLQLAAPGPAIPSSSWRLLRFRCPASWRSRDLRRAALLWLVVIPRVCLLSSSFSPRRDSLCSSSLLIVIPRGRLPKLLVVTSQETREAFWLHRHVLCPCPLCSCDPE